MQFYSPPGFVYHEIYLAVHSVFSFIISILCRFLIKRILEVVVGCQVVMSLFQQWMIPSVKNSLIPFSVSKCHIFFLITPI
jgi:hypothetical protein